jgi:prolyl oligopeptidase
MAAGENSARPYRTTATPPQTRVEPVTDVLHGTPVVDAYRWLEGDNSDAADRGKVTPEVAAWTDAQNQYTRQVLDNLPGRSTLEARLRPLMEVGSVTAPEVRAGRYFYSKREGSQNQAVVYWRETLAGESRVLVDPAEIDSTGLTTIEWFSPSPDGRIVAYGTYRAGDENTTLQLIHVDTRTVSPLRIPNRTQAPDWLPDGSGFVYQNLKHAKDPYSGQIMFHRIGHDVSRDVVLFRQFTKDEHERLSTTWGPFGTLSRDGRWLLLGYWVDTKSNDLWLVDFSEFLRTGRIERRAVSIGSEGQVSGTVVGETLILHSTKGASNGRLVTARTSAPDAAHWCDLVPSREDAVIEGVSIGKGVIAVSYLKNASNTVEVFDLSGRTLGVLNQPGIGAVSVAAEEDRTDGFLTFTSFNYPTTIFHIDLLRPSDPARLWEQPAVPVDPATAEVEQVWYGSKDGTTVSMFLVHKKGLAKDGARPTILWGYGGFNVSATPAFSATLFQWLDAGGLHAVPNLRGGGEYGNRWHEAGMLSNKQNTFDDFVAAAEWLIANEYTTSQKLAIKGGSNGGLLTGAVVTQRPDLVRAAFVEVPLLDMLRYQNFLMARYWVPEYGSAENPREFAVLCAYSPYHHVKPGTHYPAVLLTAGEHDTRVHALHARKMAARLQASTTSDPAEQPILLWVDRDAGHGQGKPLHLRLREVVDQRLFAMWQLGMALDPVASPSSGSSHIQEPSTPLPVRARI